MTRRWHKLGLIYSPTSEPRHEKLLTHAANPVPLHLQKDTYRVFFSGRDRQNRSSVGAVDIDIIERKVVCEFPEPFFVHGPQDSFYEHGVSIGNCYKVDGCTYMLFMGWQSPKTDHWRGDIGRLVVRQDFSLHLDSAVPFMAANEIDPVSLSYPWVLEGDNGTYQMWYGSTKTWDAGNGEMIHVINYAKSTDGHTWHRQGLAIPYELGTVQAFSRPTVVREPVNRYEMWFSYRSGSGEKYRIGYAHSNDGSRWDLDLQNSGITVSSEGWDSEMIEYPYVFTHNEKRYMLYNGNGFGKTGFGLAVLA